MFRHFAIGVLIFSVLGVACAQAPDSSADTPARLFDKGMNAIRGSAQNRNDVQAFDAFRRSAELGYAPAQVMLGYCYENNFLVSTEFRRALDWYKKAAQQGDPLAAWLVGRLMYTGAVAPYDKNDALAWFEKAAAAGDAFGQYLLGLVKLEKNDYAEAAEWLQKAAEQGLPQAQYRLGLLLQEGGALGVKRDKFAAYVWLLMATEANYATPDLQPLETELGVARTEEAKTRARKLQAEYSRRLTAHGCTGWDGEFDRIPSPPPPDLQQFCR